MSFDTTGDSGGDVSAQTSSAVESNLGSSNQPAESTSHLDLTSDSLIRIDGKGNPVKFSDYTKGFQSQATKAAQEAAQLRRELTRIRQAQQDAERQRQLEAQRGGQPQRPDLAAQLESLTYLDGKQAADVVRQIQQDIQYRDQILLAALQHIKQMQGTVKGLNETHVTQSFEGRLGNWISEGGYPDTKAVRDFARSLYLSYEPGPELDQEFPEIFRAAYDQMLADFDTQRQAKLNQQRQARFVPGKGGNVGPRQPIQPKVDASAREMADLLFDSLQEFGT